MVRYEIDGTGLMQEGVSGRSMYKVSGGEAKKLSPCVVSNGEAKRCLAICIDGDTASVYYTKVSLVKGYYYTVSGEAYPVGVRVRLSSVSDISNFTISDLEAGALYATKSGDDGTYSIENVEGTGETLVAWIQHSAQTYADVATYSLTASVEATSAVTYVTSKAIGESSYVECGICGGTGTEACSYCGGTGTYTYTMSETYDVNEACTECGGSGTISESCSTCGGSGSETCHDCWGSGEVESGTDEEGNTIYETCPNCGGSGTITCTNCGGSGSIDNGCPSCGGVGTTTHTEYQDVEYEESCPSCGGQGSWACSSCGGNGYTDQIILADYEALAFVVTGKCNAGTEIIYVSTNSSNLVNTVKASATPDEDGSYTLGFTGDYDITYYIWYEAEDGILTTHTTYSVVDISVCLSGDTLIMMADGTQKRLEDIREGARLRSGDGTETTVTRISERGHFRPGHILYTFEDGTIINEVHEHRFYNVEQGFWQKLMNWEIGEHARREDGAEVALVSVEMIEDEPTEMFGLWTESGSYFANGLLSGDASANQPLLTDATAEQAADMALSIGGREIMELLGLEEMLIHEKVSDTGGRKCTCGMCQERRC